MNRKSKVFLKISPRGSKLPQGLFLLLKNIVMKKVIFLIFFNTKYAKKNRNKILRRSVPITSQIDRKSYELWSKEFLSKNEFLSQNVILKIKNKISKSKHFRFFIKHSFFDSNIDLFLSKIFHSYGKTIYFNKSLIKYVSKTIIFDKLFYQTCPFFRPQNVSHLPTKYFIRKNPCSTTIPFPENQWLYSKKHIFHFSFFVIFP